MPASKHARRFCHAPNPTVQAIGRVVASRLNPLNYDVEPPFRTLGMQRLPLKYVGRRNVANLKSYIDANNVIDMNNAPAGSRTNAAGYARNSPWFWRQMLKEYPEMFSETNREMIGRGRAPMVDDVWIKANPKHASFAGESLEGDVLIHHHIRQGRYASGLPQRIHRAGHGTLHPER